MDPSEITESDRVKLIRRSFVQHRLAVEDARVHSEGRTATVVDAEPIDLDVTTTPKKRSPTLAERQYKHLTPELKNAIVNSVMSGNTYRTASKIFNVSVGTISSLMRRSQEELDSKTQSGGKRKSRIIITPDIVQKLFNIVSKNPQHSLREMREELIKKEEITLSLSSISALLKNMEITCKRLYKEPPERNSPSYNSMRIEWAHTFKELKCLGCKFLFVDESGFNVSLSRGRGYARVGESPSVVVPPKGPNITLIALMGKKIGLVYEKYIGGVNAKTFEDFLTSAAPKIKEAYGKKPIVIILDNARIHKGSKVDNIDIPKTIKKLGFFHLFTIPYSPQLNAIEMAFAQLKSYVISEFMKFPEKRKNLGSVIDESMGRITQKHIKNYYSHQATIVTQCKRGIPLTPDTLKYNEVDMDEEENPDEVYEQDTKELLDDVAMFKRK